MLTCLKTSSHPLFNGSALPTANEHTLSSVDIRKTLYRIRCILRCVTKHGAPNTLRHRLRVLGKGHASTRLYTPLHEARSCLSRCACRPRNHTGTITRNNSNSNEDTDNRTSDRNNSS
ncbi:unnamed protein product, partial [Ectocarpus sp. 12 AP-2014]